MKTHLISSLLVLSGLVHLPAFAHDGHDHPVSRQSACGGGVKSEISASPEDGRIEATYEVRNATPGDTWRLVIYKNGVVIHREDRRVNQRGKAKASVLTANRNGNDTITGKGTRVGGGGSCKAAVVVRF